MTEKGIIAVNALKKLEFIIEKIKIFIESIIFVPNAVRLEYHKMNEFALNVEQRRTAKENHYQTKKRKNMGIDLRNNRNPYINKEKNKGFALSAESGKQWLVKQNAVSVLKKMPNFIE